MSIMWLLLLSRVRLRRPLWFVPLVKVFLVGVVIAGLIYACVFFNAVGERSHARHVHTYSAQ